MKTAGSRVANRAVETFKGDSSNLKQSAARKGIAREPERKEYAEAKGLPMELQIAWKQEIDHLYSRQEEQEHAVDCSRLRPAPPEELQARKIGNLSQRAAALGRVLESELQYKNEVLRILGVTRAHEDAFHSGDRNAIRTAVLSNIERQAIALASGQGCHRIPKLPDLNDRQSDFVAAANEAKAAFEAANQEPDPLKRAQLFQKAERLAESLH